MRRWVVVLPSAAAFAAGLMGLSAHMAFEAEADTDVAYAASARAIPPLPAATPAPPIRPPAGHPRDIATTGPRFEPTAPAPVADAPAGPGQVEKQEHAALPDTATSADRAEVARADAVAPPDAVPAVAVEAKDESEAEAQVESILPAPPASVVAGTPPAHEVPAGEARATAMDEAPVDPAEPAAAVPEAIPGVAEEETEVAARPPADDEIRILSDDEFGLRRKVLEIGRGDTLLAVLVEAAVPRDEAIQAIDALRRVFNPRSLKIGQEIAVVFDRTGGQDRFMGLTITPNVQRSVTVSRGHDDSYEARAVDRPLETRAVAASGRISSSLFEAGISAGLPIPVLTEVIKLFSYDVDFQRDIQRDDAFRILFERAFTDEGVAAREGDILMAELTLSGKAITFYRYRTRDGLVDYFNGRGESIRKALLRTPVDGAKLTSGFGLRRHPILGYSKLHAGVDFGAPTGTPIYAAGAGTIDEIGGKGAYGNYVRIRHNKDIATAYAHMSRFASGLQRGARVRQGEVIGYVGSTGRSTGPHLHYEVLKNERQVNPLSVDLPTGQALEGKELLAFRKHVEGLERQYASSRTEPLIAETVGLLRPPGPKPLPTAAGKACSDQPC